MAQRPKHLKHRPEFPSLKKNNHDVTSDIDPRYNCIAYAAGITNRKYWPNFHPDFYWPQNIPKLEQLSSFVSLYETFGYRLLTDESAGKYQEGVEKIAIFASANGKPTHAARQIGPNKWASKLGDSFDIVHQETAVSGGLYGKIVAYMSRPKSTEQ